MPLDLLILFISISVLILVHEFGHFIAARFFGLFVEEFGLGLPPKLGSKKIGETTYSINALPMGGFVKLHGEDEHSYQDTNVKKPTRAFFKRPWWQKSIVLTAGVAMNFIFAVSVLSYLFTKGVVMPDGVEIKQVVTQSPADKAGFQSGDILLKIEDQKITQVFEVTKIISENLDQQISFEILRNQKTIRLSAIPRKNPPEGQGALGVVLNQRTIIKKYPFYLAPFYGVKSSIEMSFLLVRAIVGVFWDFISGFKVPSDVAGPIGMYQLYGQARKYGFDAVLELSGLISLNLAVMNLFPIPPLDGSRLLFVIAERVSGKKLRRELEHKIYQISFMFLILLFILISIQDIKRLFSG